MFMSRSLKTEALSILLLRLIMYIMLMSRPLKNKETRNILYYCDLAYILCLCFVLYKPKRYAYYCCN